MDEPAYVVIRIQAGRELLLTRDEFQAALARGRAKQQSAWVLQRQYQQQQRREAIAKLQQGRRKGPWAAAEEGTP